jgi:hypothetical protein
MEWFVVVLLVIFAPVIWAMVGHLRRGTREDETYNGQSSDPTLMEMGRQHHGQMR